MEKAKFLEIKGEIERAVNDNIPDEKEKVAAQAGIEELYKLSLDANFAMPFYNSLGIIGGAFSVLEAHSREPLLLFRREKNYNPDVEKSDFFWFPYEVKYYSEETANIIDQQFLTTRQAQKLDELAPDFLRFLFVEKYRGDEYEHKKLTNGIHDFHSFPVIYCDNTEMLIFILCYLEIAKNLKNSDTHFAFPADSIEIATKNDENSEVYTEKVLQNYLHLKDNEQYEKLYTDLGLFDTGRGFNDVQKKLIRRIASSGLIETSNDITTIPEFINFLRDLIKNRFNATGDLKYENTLYHLHEFARFPIIPYLTLFLERKPEYRNTEIAHLVVPLWKTYLHAPEVRLENDSKKQLNHVVFALLTVVDTYEAHNFKDKFFPLFRVIRRIGDITADTIFYNKFTYKNIKQQAFKAAISHVLLRNNAHNLGSHVSYRATNTQIKNRARELESIELKKKIDGSFDNINLPEFAEWLDYFSDKLDKYEIYRNEYLSDMNLSPKSVKFYADVVLPFCENTFLMDNIAAGELLNYKINEAKTNGGNGKLTRNRLRVKCCINGKEIRAAYPKLKPMFSDEKPEICYPDKFPYLLDKTEDANTFADAINAKEFFGGEDVEICLHSEQAIYSILENFIRNSAKHGHKTDELIVHLDLLKGNGYYELCIYDNNRSMAIPDKLISIFDSIQEDLVNDQGTPLKKNWGLADMKINSFLLYHDFETIESSKIAQNFDLIVAKESSSESCPNFTEVTKEDLKSIKQKDENKSYQFGYKLKLSIPKQILWIGDHDETLERLKPEGLEIVKTFEELKTAAERRQGLSSFQFAVVNQKFDYEDYLKKYQEQLPSRVIVLNSIIKQPEKPSVLIIKNDMPPGSLQDVPKMLKWCWQTWLTRVGKDIDLYLYFDNDKVAEKWSGVSDLGKKLKLEIINNLTEHSINKEKKYSVFYDHHGEGFKKKKDNRRCLATAGYKRADFATQNSIICFGGGSEDFSSLNYPPAKTEDKEQILFQRADAATTNIFIIDERISEAASNEISNKFNNPGRTIGSEDFQGNNWAMYAAGKVFVVNEVVNRNGESFFIGSNKKEDEKLTLDISGETTMKFVSQINQMEGIDKISKDILIIHRTYLDEERIKMKPEIFLEEASGIFGSVFITSGGGYPHNLKGKWRFISFSTLEACVNSQLAKNRLNNILRTNLK